MGEHHVQDITIVIFFKTLFQTLGIFSTFIFYTPMFCFNVGLDIVIQLMKYLALCSVLKLLNLSRYLEQISGGRVGHKEPEKKEGEKPTVSETEKSKSKKGRQKLKKSPTREPSFNTTLTTPIEEAIEETLNEEVISSDNAENKARKRTKVVKVKSEKSETTDVVKRSKKRKTEAKPSEGQAASESQDSTFLQVKERRKKNPKSKIDDLPKSSIIAHYQPIKNKNPELTVKDEFVIIEKSDLEISELSKKKLPENCVPIVNRQTGKTVYLETRESKKVHSKIAYASVASQRFEESLEQLQKVEEKLLGKLTDSSEHEESQTITIQVDIHKTADYLEKVNTNFDLDLPEKIDDSEDVKNEELAKEIQSEEQRLVDLLEEDNVNVLENTLLSSSFEDYEKFVHVNQVQNITSVFISSEQVAEAQNSAESKSFHEVVSGKVDVVSNGFLEANRLILEDITEDQFKEEATTSEEELLKEEIVEEKAEHPHVNGTTKPTEALSDVGGEDILDKFEEAETGDEISDTFLDLSSQLQQKDHFIGIIKETKLIEESYLTDNKEFTICTSNGKVTETLASELQNKRDSSHNIKNSQLANNSAAEVLIEDNISEKNPGFEGQSHRETIDSKESLVEQETFANLNKTTSDSKPFKMSSGTQVRVLTLNRNEHQDSTLYRLEKNWVLQFRLGPSLLGRKVLLYCNCPKENEEFKRQSYNLLKWRQDEGCNYADDTALLTEITLKTSGSFHYYFIYENAEKDKHQGSGFFLVDPVLKYGNNEQLPLDCIQCQTVLTKGLGPCDTWENKLRVAKESGYNMIHFTPIQELGASNSSYSLSEQLKVNPLFNKQNGEKTTFEDIDSLIKKIRAEWKMVSICDIVLNHTANESTWLIEHPEVTYNCQNCPHMRPAYLLDAALHQFSMDVAKGLYDDRGIPMPVTCEDHLNAIRYYIRSEVLAKLKLHELSTCDVNRHVTEFLNQVRNRVPPNQANSSVDGKLTLIQDPLYRRLASTVDMKLAAKLYNVYRNDCYDEETRIKKCAADFKNRLDHLNEKVVNRIDDHLNAAVDNVIAGIRYFRVQHDGPKVREISVKNPLVSRYFTDHGKPTSISEHEEIMYSDDGRFLMAHNGWVMNSDPLKNFADSDSNVYIRRELIAWGDSVKLRFGDKPEDCPYLWEHMRTYVETTARIFDGVRLDNCHSTPIPVAEYLLDCARKVRPNLYVVAELFTNSDMTDNIFVNRLGITSLIREAMSAWDSHEQGRLVYRYGGSPVGSFYQPRVRPLVPSIAHALFLDLTHDNPSPVEKRSVFDLLPSTALVNMACCASGSNRGYDELVPHHIHVVDEARQYTEWCEDENLATENVKYVTNKSGIIAAKKALNDLHFLLGAEGFGQVYVDQMDPDVVAVTRHCPETHQSYVLVAFTAFSHPSEDAAEHQRGIRPLRVEGVLDEIVLEATLSRVNAESVSKYTKSQNFQKDTKCINGFSEYEVHLKQHIQPESSGFFEKVNAGSPNVIELSFKNFKPGSIAIIKVSLPQDMAEAIGSVRNLISKFSLKKENELWKIISQMTLPDLNRALYRCDQEERDEGHGFDTYNIPNFDRLVYAGFQGFMSLLCNIRPNNDLGHPMCANLRDGNWMIDYIWQRLKLDEGTKPLGQWFEENAKSLKAIPRYLVPCYFDVIVTGIYVLLFEQSYNLMSDFVKSGSTFVKGLAMGSIQFAAYIKSADLPTLSPNLAEPKPPLRRNDKGENVQSCVTLSAGLPHFAVGYMRNWGRDTFIALRGLFLLTGRFQDARYHLLGYAACLRHGLIPNLLDGGRNSRFNCRDAIWWWLHCIKCYTEDAPEGLAILSDKVSRIFPTDDSPPQSPGAVEQPLHEVIQEALNTHFQGLVFRERNAGRQIDEQMTDHGFNNQIGVHPDTGFVFGGNSSNCGTWMDKMGSSAKSGNKGKPATPRDGSAIELIGLSKAVVTWLDDLSGKGVYPYKGVERTGKNGIVTKWTFKEWADKIQNNFEKYFWVNTTPTESEIRPDLINKRGIYKDSFGASQEWADFQLRCNFPIAMVAAPELFDPKRAWIALQKAEKHLLGPLGMKTLDPEDWAYNGYYDNSNDSDNPNVANGFNYHQGPEWVWPVGFYLRAKLQFAGANGELEKTLADTKVVLSKHFVELQTSTWRGLPELTNKDGAYCNDSSRTQAWSMSCILEVLHDLQKIEKTQPLIN